MTNQKLWINFIFLEIQQKKNIVRLVNEKFGELGHMVVLH